MSKYNDRKNKHLFVTGDQRDKYEATLTFFNSNLKQNPSYINVMKIITQLHSAHCKIRYWKKLLKRGNIMLGYLATYL